jgi:imidazolonepropionase-like amidohydrolase
MRLDQELGTIERGKRADIAVLTSNPLDRIQNIRSVEWTIAGGRIYDAAKLWTSVRFKP